MKKVCLILCAFLLLFSACGSKEAIEVNKTAASEIAETSLDCKNTNFKVYIAFMDNKMEDVNFRIYIDNNLCLNKKLSSHSRNGMVTPDNFYAYGFHVQNGKHKIRIETSDGNKLSGEFSTSDNCIYTLISYSGHNNPRISIKYSDKPFLFD